MDITYNKHNSILCHSKILLTCLAKQDDNSAKNQKNNISVNLIPNLKLNNNNI